MPRPIRRDRGSANAQGEPMKPPYPGAGGEFEKLLDSSPDERDVQSFLDRYPWIVRNALNTHAWNSVHVKSQFRLGGDHITDFLVLAADSGVWHAVLIELESPSSRPFTKRGSPSRALAGGLAQLDEWDLWIRNYEQLWRASLAELLRPRSVPSQTMGGSGHQFADTELLDPRTTIMKDYIVVVGRRSSYDSSAQQRRSQYGHRGQRIASYDRLLDVAKNLDPTYGSGG